VAVGGGLAVKPGVQVGRCACERQTEDQRRQHCRERAPRRSRKRAEVVARSAHGFAKWSYTSKCVKRARWQLRGTMRPGATASGD
jgi:hypothetical protein